MIEYYKELDNPNDFEIKLYEYIHNPDIEITDCDKKTKDNLFKIITKLEKLDPLENNLFGQLTEDDNNHLHNNLGGTDSVMNIVLELVSDYHEHKNSIINFDDIKNDLNINSYKYQRLYYLFNKFIDNNPDYNFADETYLLMFDYTKLYSYISDCISLMTRFKNMKNLNVIKEYVKSLVNVLKCQNKISNTEDEYISNYLDSIVTNTKIEIMDNRKQVVVKQPDAWYITPYGYLYNSGGAGGHRGRSPYRSLWNDYKFKVKDDLSSSSNYNEDNMLIKYFDKFGYCSAKDILDNGFITQPQFKSTLNYISFYNIDYIGDQNYNDFFTKRCYDHNIVKLVTGVVSANEAVYYKFIRKLLLESNDFNRDLEMVFNTLTEDEFFVRCCGFHKILSHYAGMKTKTIVTADSNYEKDLALYIANGWNIDYVKPYVIVNGVLQESPEEHEEILEFHNKK